MQVVLVILGGLLIYLSVKLPLALALIVGAIEGLLAALALMERWPDAEFLPVEVWGGLFLAFAWGGTVGAAVVAIRLFMYLGQDLLRLTRN